MAKKKVEECKSLYIALNIERAKNERNANKYESSINYLNLALNIDSANKEAVSLKLEYSKAKEEAEVKAKLEALEAAKKAEEHKRAEESSKTVSTSKTDNNIPKERPYIYMLPFVNRFDGKMKIVQYSMNAIPKNYYDLNAKVEIIVHLKSGDKKFYGKVGEEIQLEFASDDEALGPNGREKYDAIITDKYGTYKCSSTIYNLAPYIIPG